MQSGNGQKPLGFLRLIMVIGAIILFSSLMLSIWVVQQAPYQQEFFNPWAAGNRNQVVWYSLEKEKVLFTEAGYSLSWMNHKLFGTLRSALGAYAIIFEMFALRFFGLFQILPCILIAVLFGFAEGRVAYHEKTNTFGNVSSTRFRISVLFFAFTIALCFIYVTLTFGSEIPVLGSLPLTVDLFGLTLWLTSPQLWTAVFSVLAFTVSWQIASNLTREI